MNSPGSGRAGLGSYRAACVVLWLTAVMHSVAMLTTAPDFPGEDGKELSRLMTDYKLALPGRERSMHELHRGFSWQFTAGLFGIGLIAAAVGWSSACPATIRRRLCWACCVTLAVFVLIAWKYFFVVPLACQALAGVLFGLSAAVSRRRADG